MTRDITPKRIIIYEDAYGNQPYTEWIENLRDKAGQRRILQRIIRLQHGHYGDHASVGEGVLELRMFFGPGYRVYFGEDKESIVILLCGGDKKSQRRDIRAAKQYWKDYNDAK